jgi:hypothetical protein
MLIRGLASRILNHEAVKIKDTRYTLNNSWNTLIKKYDGNDIDPVNCIKTRHTVLESIYCFMIKCC